MGPGLQAILALFPIALGGALLALPGVVSVYGIGDFVTVTRRDDVAAAALDAEVRKVIRRLV